jgi:hypothetical protein
VLGVPAGILPVEDSGDMPPRGPVCCEKQDPRD